MHGKSSVLSALAAGLVCALLAAAPLAAQVAERPRLVISAYVIDAEIDAAAHRLQATAVVSFTAPENASQVTFGFHPALKVEKITDQEGRLLTGDRLADGSIRVVPAAPFLKGQTARWTFAYGGTLTGSEDGPVQGLRLAAIQDPITYLLYPARWFPMTGYMTDRFTAQMRIRVPQGMRVLASGAVGQPLPVTLSNGKPGGEFGFNWTRPGFPGTVIAGRFVGPVSAGPGNVNVFLTAPHEASANQLAQTAAHEFDFFTGSFGQPESPRLNVVELPGDTLPAAWAPELAAIMGSRVDGKSGVRLLANTIAHQWWGSETSPRTLDDAWITNGMARYAELMYLENESGREVLKSALNDVAAGALAYDTIPLSSAGRLDPFSPQFQSMTLEKGAMIFHMLRGEIGDKAFLDTLRGALAQFADAPIRTRDFIKVAEAHSQQQLTAFFSQWVDSTGAPAFTNKYTIYRLGNNKGFRTIGEIGQDLDLFNMPVELRIDTDGKTVTQKIDVVGTSSQYVVDTFGRPRRVSLDPDGWVLKTTPDLEVRVAILKGQQLVAQGGLVDALAEYQKALKVNPISSLANYRIGEILFTQRNYQASVNAFRDALRGDDDPPWTEIWSHLQIGKIFDLTGQRERAINEYRLAIQTNDNTQGGVNEARMYLQKPYTRPDGD